MITISEIEVVYNDTKKLGASGIANYADGAMKILLIINENPEAEIIQKGLAYITDLLEKLISVDFAFRLLHPIGLFLVSEAQDEVTTKFFPYYLTVYEEAGGNGVSTYDADYSLNLQAYTVHLTQRKCDYKGYIARLVDEAVESSMGFSQSSGHRPPLLDSFIYARANITSQFDTDALKSSSTLNDATWKDLLDRR